ncbi:MAG: CHAP domain-containing protein [Oscillibacter sp.]|nr:CHAP domain-containing protein [Oscillibacter sp.]
MKKSLSLALAFILTVSLFCIPANASSSKSLAEVAADAVGRSYSDLNLPSSNWCGYFVGYCINHSTVSSFAEEEISRADSMNPMTLINWACAKKSIGTYYSLSSTHYNRLVGKYQNLSIATTTANDFIPKPGDIIVFDWNGREDSKHVFSHVGIVTGEYNASSADFTYVDGNSGAGNYTYVVKKTSGIGNNSIIGYIRVNGDKQNVCATHTKGAYLWCEKAHPHYNYFTCAVCGNRFTDGTTDILDSCAQCQLTATPVETPIVSISEGAYTLAPQCAPNLRLDVASGSTENKANIQIYQNNNTVAQQFEFTYVGDGYYSIIAKVSGKCLDVQEGKNVSGTNVWQYTPNSTDAQLWMLEDAGDGYYYIIPKLNTGLCLDVYSAKSENRTNVQVYSRNQTNAQKWALIPLDTTSKEIPATTPSNNGYWGVWSEWSTSYVEESGTRHVESRQAKVSDEHTEYRYGRFVDSTGAKVCWCKKYLESLDSVSGSATLQYSDWSANRYDANGKHWGCGFCNGDHIGVDFTSADGRAWWAQYELPGGHYYWEETRIVEAQYETQYRYQDWIPG